MMSAAYQGLLLRHLAYARSWIDGLRHRLEFRALLAEAEDRYRSAVDAFVRAGGDRLLGSVGT